MTLDGFHKFCAALPHTHHVVQWGGAHVWKVASKVFVIGRGVDGQLETASFKCSPLMFEVLKNEPGMQPAPYLASRGMSWLQRTSSQSMSDAALKEALRESYRLASLTLTKTLQQQLGLNQDSTNQDSIKKKSRSGTARSTHKQSAPAPRGRS